MGRSKIPGAVVTAEEQARMDFKRVDAKQSIADRQSDPEFQENFERLRRERMLRTAQAEQEQKPKAK